MAACGFIIRPSYVARRVSAAAILNGEVKSDALANQVAIIGATAVGVSDVVATPLSSRMDGVEIQAQLVENMLEGSRLQRPPSARWWELLALLALALPLIFFLRGFGPSIRQSFFAVSAALAIISLWLFKQYHFLFDATFPAAGNLLVVLLLLFAGFAASERRRRELAAALEEQRIERLRVAGESAGGAGNSNGHAAQSSQHRRTAGSSGFFRALGTGARSRRRSL